MTKTFGMAVLLFCTLAVAPAATAVSACSDGVDNDGDGSTDGSDAGCSQPLRLDDSEAYYWDTDASALLGGSTGLTKRSPGAVFDGQTRRGVDSGSLNERFVQSPGSDSGGYGGGSLSSRSVAPDSSESDVRSTGFLGITGSREYVDPPRGDDCGDGDDDGESSLDCPTDVGMAEDVGESPQTVSDITGKLEIQPSNRIEMKENSGSHTYDMRSSDGGANYGLDESSGAPDYYINPSDSDRLMELGKPSTGTSTLGSVNSQTSLYDNTVDAGFTTIGIRNSGCTGANCSVSGTVNYCSSSDLSTTTRYDHKLVSDTVSLSESVTDVHTESSGVGFSLSTQNGGTISVQVTRNVVADDGQLTEYSCPTSSTTTVYSCDGTGCVMSEDARDHVPVNPTTYQLDIGTSETETFTYTTIPTSESQWPRSTFLNVDNAGAENEVAEDYGTVHHAKEGGTGYFSVDPGRDSIAFGNNRAFGWSTFDLTMQGDEFATERTSFQSYEPDGNNGGGDALVAVHDGEGIVGSTSSFGPLLSASDISVSCPGGYTKCVAAVDVSLNSFDTWSRHDNPSSGAEYDVIARAGLGEGLSACKMYQELNSGGEPVQCTYEHGNSPLPYGPYTDEPGEFKGVFDGPAADTSRNTDNPVFVEHQISENQCVFNGSVYDEGSLKDIGEEVTLASGDRHVEQGGYNIDQEVCLNMDSDVQGEWHDLDKASVNGYVTSNSFSVSTGESVDSVVESNPDGSADPATGVISQGGSLEDDCYSTLSCGDEGSPYYVPFYEGAVTADYNPFVSGGDTDGDGQPETTIDLERWRNTQPIASSISSVSGSVEIPSDITGSPPRGVTNAQEAEGVHNTANTSQGSSHGSGTGQDTETTMTLGDLENSRIDSSDDEWGLSPNLSYVVDNYGESHRVSRCHGQSRTQGNDLDKTQRIYANSYANQTPEGGEWVNPDNTNRTISRGGTSCDLTGQDWGIAYDNFATTSSGALPEEGGSISGITFVGKGKLIPPSGGGSGRPGSDTICFGSGCTRSTGSPTDEDTDDTTVDETGDTMSGTLAAGKLKNNANLCIGADCRDNTHEQGPAFSDTNQDADGADIIVPDIYPQGGSGLCVGADC